MLSQSRKMDHGGNGFELENICNGWNWMKQDENLGILKNVEEFEWIMDIGYDNKNE